LRSAELCLLQLVVLASSRSNACWSGHDLIASLSFLNGRVSTCHIFSTFRICSVVSEHQQTLLWLEPCRVQPSLVWMAAGPPGGPNLTGSMGVIKWMWSAPIRTRGWTFMNCCSGSQARCLPATGYDCSASPSRLEVKASWMWYLHFGCAAGDMKKDTDVHLHVLPDGQVFCVFHRG